MLLTFVLSFIVIALAAYAVKKASRQAANSRKFIRNRFIGIWLLSTGAMAALILLKQPAGLSVMFAWLPAMVVGVVAEHWRNGRGRAD